MTVAERIISRFGGLAALARALGHKNPTTVQGWKERGLIPAHQQLRVLNAAKAKEIAIKPEDFFDLAPKRASKGEGPTQ